MLKSMPARVRHRTGLEGVEREENVRLRRVTHNTSKPGWRNTGQGGARRRSDQGCHASPSRAGCNCVTPTPDPNNSGLQLCALATNPGVPAVFACAAKRDQGMAPWPPGPKTGPCVKHLQVKHSAACPKGRLDMVSESSRAPPGMPWGEACALCRQAAALRSQSQDRASTSIQHHNTSIENHSQVVSALLWHQTIQAHCHTRLCLSSVL